MHRRSLDYYLLLKNMASSETELCRKSAIFQVITQPIEVIKSASDWNYKVFTEANFYLSILANPKLLLLSRQREWVVALSIRLFMQLSVAFFIIHIYK